MGGLLVGAVGAAALMIAASLSDPEVAEHAPTPADAPAPAEEDGVVGPAVRTVDATSSDRWTFFSFEAGGVVEEPAPDGWDLAFRRFRVIANGGDGFAGRGGALDLGALPPDAPLTAPTEGWVPTTARSDSTNDALADWYDYRMMSHLLSPKPRTFAVRTADGRHAVLRFLGYYCPGARPGCVTFAYAWRPDGGRAFPAGALDAGTPATAGSAPSAGAASAPETP